MGDKGGEGWVDNLEKLLTSFTDSSLYRNANIAGFLKIAFLFLFQPTMPWLMLQILVAPVSAIQSSSQFFFVNFDNNS